jgi:hypothetical protein
LIEDEESREFFSDSLLMLNNYNRKNFIFDLNGGYILKHPLDYYDTKSIRLAVVFNDILKNLEAKGLGLDIDELFEGDDPNDYEEDDDDHDD